jgi:hypothetical protein
VFPDAEKTQEAAQRLIKAPADSALRPMLPVAQKHTTLESSTAFYNTKYSDWCITSIAV